MIIATLISQGDQLVTAVAPGGMIDHQTAGTALRVDQIHQSWADAGKTGYVKIAMLFDLLFIVIYSVGGVIGGMLVRRDAASALLRGLAPIVIAAYFLFGVLDFIETVCQTIQLYFTGGSDALAGVAKLAQPPKLLAFAIGFPSMVIALIWFWLDRKRAGAVAG